MTLEEILAYQAQRLEALTRWQDRVIARFEPPSSPAIAAPTAPAEGAPGAATVDANTERHAAMAQRVLRATARHERRVLEVVAQRSSSTSATATAGPASPGHDSLSGESP